MSRCLRDRTLWLMSEGDARPEDRAHVASCMACAARLRRLEQDLGRLRTVLTGPLPVHAVPTRLRPARMRWMTAAATVAMLTLTVWLGSWWQRPSPPALRTEAAQESVWPFIEGLSMALFTPVDAGAIGSSDQLPDLGDLQAALVGDWPCEGQDVLGQVACDEGAFILLFTGQDRLER